MIYFCTIKTPLGKMRACEKNGFIRGLWFEGQEHFPNVENWREKDTEVLKDLKNWLDRYFKGFKDEMNLPLLLEGTLFRLKVWGILQAIPYGHTITYGDIAKMLEREKGIAKMSAQAIGGAVGHNPISILVPCHRVIGANGKITGYAGGIDKKSFLLNLEGVKI